MLYFMGAVIVLLVALRRCGLNESLRWTLAIQGVLVWILAGFFYWLAPGEGKIAESMPLMACDVLALIAPLSLVIRTRTLRAATYFGAFGLSIQAYVTPAIDSGPETARYWMFWLVHGNIMICAIYDLIGERFRPDRCDLLRAIGFWFVYGVAMIILDYMTGWYYGYLGPTLPEYVAGSVLKNFGEWPIRPGVMMVFATVVFVLLWLPWAIAGKFHRTPSPSAARST